MCGGVEEHNWRKEPPDEPGEWAWLIQWECGCVHRYGIAWVVTRDEAPDGMLLIPNNLALSWEGQRLRDAGIADVIWWKKEQIPFGYDDNIRRGYMRNYNVGLKPHAVVKMLCSQWSGGSPSKKNFEAGEQATIVHSYMNGMLEVELSGGRTYAVPPDIVELVQA